MDTVQIPAAQIAINDGIVVDGHTYKVTDAFRATFIHRDTQAQMDTVCITYWTPGMGRPGRAYFPGEGTADNILPGAFVKKPRTRKPSARRAS